LISPQDSVRRPRSTSLHDFFTQNWLEIRMYVAKELDEVTSTRAALATQVESLLARLHPAVPVERRRDIRYPIPVLFSLTPLDSDRQPIEAESVTVVGKNISRRGMSFYHERPLPHRWAVITLADPQIGNFTAEIDVSWCRFRRPGWYESGGRLLRAFPNSIDSNTPSSVDGGPILNASLFGESATPADD